MKAFEKIERPRLSQLIAEKLEEAIISGTFETGSRLPSEQALADQFGVSRNVVREAFKVLEERGLIEIITGSGTYVCQPSPHTATDALERYIRLIGADSSIEALAEARRILEGANARLVAQRANEQDLERLAVCLTRMEQHVDSIEEWAEADLDFHLAVAEATHNPFLSVLLEPLVGQLRNMIARASVVSPSSVTGLGPHRRLYQCIKNGDAEGAYQAMLEHISGAEAFLESRDEITRT